MIFDQTVKPQNFVYPSFFEQQKASVQWAATYSDPANSENRAEKDLVEVEENKTFLIKILIISQLCQ